MSHVLLEPLKPAARDTYLNVTDLPLEDDEDDWSSTTDEDEVKAGEIGQYDKARDKDKGKGKMREEGSIGMGSDAMDIDDVELSGSPIVTSPPNSPGGFDNDGSSAFDRQIGSPGSCFPTTGQSLEDDKYEAGHKFCMDIDDEVSEPSRPLGLFTSPLLLQNRLASLYWLDNSAWEEDLEAHGVSWRIKANCTTYVNIFAYSKQPQSNRANFFDDVPTYFNEDQRWRELLGSTDGAINFTTAMKWLQWTIREERDSKRLW
ncbi:hypothetical protein LXA43DRAFT_1097016 [Ganoderma leucocontextum]|nr:hypothetical protein LXA43DRAFT_1097016 [Ganoderma leucocontextum]